MVEHGFMFLRGLVLAILFFYTKVKYGDEKPEIVEATEKKICSTEDVLVMFCDLPAYING